MRFTSLSFLSLLSIASSFTFSPHNARSFLPKILHAPSSSVNSAFQLNAYLDSESGSPSSPMSHPSRAKGLVPRGYVSPDVQVEAAWVRVKGLLDGINAAKGSDNDGEYARGGTTGVKFYLPWESRMQHHFSTV